MLDWLSAMAVKNRGRDDTSTACANDSRSGLVAGTLVATQRGWTPVEEVCVGDDVLTFDDGVRVVTGVTRSLYPMQPADASGLAPLMSLPAGVVGNQRAILAPKGQAFLIESDFAETLLDDPFALLNAGALSGIDGIRNILPEAPVVVVTLSFDEDQMIFVEGHALAHCPSSKVAMPASIDDAIWAEESTRYHVLSQDAAEIVVAEMVLQGRTPSGSTRTAPRPNLV